MQNFFGKSKILIIILITFSNILYSQALLTRQPYLNSVTENSIVIRWRTDIPTDTKLSFGPDLNYGTDIVDNNLVTEHEVLVNNLQNSSKYFYRIGSTIQVLQGDLQNYFNTSKPQNSTFKVWVTGDFGVSSSGQTAVKNAYKSYVGANPADLWIWLGDNAYTYGTDLEFTNNTFNKYPEILKNTPIYPAIGNHDYGQVGYLSTAAATNNFPYFQQFTLPQNGEAGGLASNTEKYYSYNYGDAHFIVLDSYGAPNIATSPMYLWLKSDLDQNTRKWTICYFHHPPYTKGTHNSDTEVELMKMRENIIPLLESKNVDLVLAGHSHVYERSFMINGHYGMANTFGPTMKLENLCEPNNPNFVKNTTLKGTIYAVCGVSGQGGNVTVASSWPHQAMEFYDKTKYGSMLLEIQKDTLHSKFLSSTGAIFDSFKIVKPDKCSDLSIATSLSSGNWNSINSWECDKIPAISSCVIIQTGHMITVPVEATIEVKKLVLNGQILINGILKFSN